ncbi:MAG: sugar porter family MFS transporter [Chlamydiales bacterium]|nr:sugar porter family MFS transporter [Chlamydiia bacterium]MCP5505244.1 sugar porter family MFS transporter [Chlamydiales bacterium]
MVRESLEQRIILAVISCVAAIGGFLFGYDTGVISGAILYIKQEYALTIFQEELIISMVSLGAILGAISGGPLCDKLGRKKIVLSSSLIFIISAIGLSLAGSINGIIGWRFLVGFAIGVSSATAPLYIAELSPRHIRGGLVTINQLFITIGILGSYLIGFLFVESQSWRIMFVIAGIPAAIQFFIMVFFPESPRYLTNVGETERAFNILKKFRATEEHARLEIAHIEKMRDTRKPHWSELLSKRVRPALLAGVGVTIIQQITGINTIIYYAPTIFEFSGVGSDKAALLATTWVGTINVLMTFVAIYLLDKVGRKPLLLFGIGGMAISLIILGIGFDQTVSKGLVGIMTLICLFVYIASFAYSLGPIGWLLNSEIYPLHIRGKAMGVATCANWVSNFIVTATFLNLINIFGKAGTFWLYGAIGILGLFFIWRRVPETKGKSLEEIEDFWK